VLRTRAVRVQVGHALGLALLLIFLIFFFFEETHESFSEKNFLMKKNIRLGFFFATEGPFSAPFSAHFSAQLGPLLN
jgi:hypothetical protein